MKSLFVWVGMIALFAVGFMVSDPSHVHAAVSHGGLNLAHLGFGAMAFAGITNKISLRSVEQFMSDYVPVYNPLYPLFLRKSQQYAAEVGKLDFRRVQTVGDIRAKHITPKDSEMKQVAVMDGKKSFKKYFLANQHVTSQVQDQEGLDEVIAQVLDEHQVQADELFLLGEGTSTSTMVNNGLYWSNDPNYTLESIIATISATNRARLLYGHIQGTLSKAKQVAGEKVVVLYGSETKKQFNSLLDSSDRALATALREASAGVSFVEMPDAPTPSSAEGWIVANLDQVKTHYTWLPQLLGQGFNEEKMHYWSNFAMGSMMVEVLAKDAVVRQPVSYA